MTKISYNKRFGKDGIVYTQTIKVSHNQLIDLAYKIDAEIALKLPQKIKYIFTSGYECFMKPLILRGNICYLNLTQLRFINLYLNNNRIKLDRNTILEVE